LTLSACADDTQDWNMSADPKAPLDRTVALALVEGDVELLKEIALLFLEEYPRVLSDLHKALDAGDSKAVERYAHALRGSAANFGARAVLRAALELEQLGRAGKMSEVLPVLSSLELSLAALHGELRRLRECHAFPPT
jgi:two-component system sensor histidine kinase/response regulator